MLIRLVRVRLVDKLSRDHGKGAAMSCKSGRPGKCCGATVDSVGLIEKLDEAVYRRISRAG
jgi:hypothetical protein